jgi:hypothetical protein
MIEHSTPAPKASPIIMKSNITWPHEACLLADDGHDRGADAGKLELQRRWGAEN